MAIAAADREIADSSPSWPPAASCTRHVLENATGSLLAAMACEALPNSAVWSSVLRSC